MSGTTYTLLAVALIGPVLTAVLLRYLRSRMTALPFYSIGSLLFGLSAGAVIWLALADIDRVELGGLTIAQNQGANLLALPTSSGPQAPIILPTAPSLTALPTSTSAATIAPQPTARSTATTQPTPTVRTTPTIRPTVTLQPTVTLAPTATPAPPTATPQPEQPPAQRTYTVQPGDTLRSIAEQFDVTVQAIIDTNGLTEEEADSLQPGDELIIP